MCAKVNACKCLTFIMKKFVNIFVQIFRRLINVSFYKFLSVVIVLIIICCVQRQLSSEYEEYPIIVWWTSGFPGISERIQCPNNMQCLVMNSSMAKKHKVDAYMFYGSGINFHDLPLPRRPNDIIWGLIHEESPRNVEELLHEPVLSLFNYSSTFSRYSDVPFPLQYIGSIADVTSRSYFVETSVKNSYLDKIAPILYLQSDCETSTERDDYVKALMAVTKIDSYGTCLKNKEMSNKFVKDYLNRLDDDEFLDFIARYKFVVAIENGVCNDYITEKFWRAIKVGSVPIYFGSPSIRDWLPNNKSAILLEDFPTIQLMSEHIKILLDNDDLYEQYLQHKIGDVISNTNLINEIRARPYQTDPLEISNHFECFICQKLYDKRAGKLGVNIVDKSHHNCPKPISALSLTVNPANNWVYSWDIAKIQAESIFKKVLGN